MSGWQCCGASVEVARRADIPTLYRLGNGYYRTVVQKALDEVRPWRKSQDPIRTISLMYELMAIVVPINGRRVLWAKHRGHHAMQVGDSPFVEVTHPVLTRLFTVELTGTPEKPMLTRAYPGGYTPPLPWMRSVEEALDGVETAIEFWRTHAYVLTSGVVEPGSTHTRAPSWFRK